MNRLTASIPYLTSLFAAALIAGNAPGAAPVAPKKPTKSVAPEPKTAASEKAFRGFLDAQCFSCHDSDTKKGGLALDALALKLDDAETFEKWTRVFDRLKSGEMPPPKEPRPDARQLATHLDFLRQALFVQNQKRQAAIGRTVLRRLNRVEYENTLHDLLAIETPLIGLLPEDTSLYGFDTVAEGLRLSQLHMEKYLEAADVALDAAVRLTAAPEPIKKRFLYKEQDGIRKNVETEHAIILDIPDAVVIFQDASYITRVGGLNIRESGNYRIRASGWSYHSATPVILQLYAGNYQNGTNRLLGYFDMPTGDNPQPREVEVTTRLEKGEYLYPSPDGLESGPGGKNIYNVGAKAYAGSGLALQWIEVEGPLLESWPPPSVSRLFADTPLSEVDKKKRRFKNGNPIAYDLAPANAKDAIRPLVERFATRAFRRPLIAGEVDGIVKIGEDSLAAGNSFEDAMRAAYRAVLLSPEFLLFEEKPGKLDDYALASRLSYFLWSAPPDDELLKLAAAKQLAQPAVLRAQTERLLNSPKAAAFTKNFVGQWLDLRAIDDTSPDSRLYPEFDDLLKVSMVDESEAFFNEMLKNDLPITNFITSDWTMLNRRLAEHYGIEGVDSESFRRVSLPADSPRGGVLTQAAVLKVTANGTTTSPVLRGAWVMKRILGVTPQPPPPGVGAIEPDTRGATTIREQLDKHRNSETCAGCHRAIDPPGFALENFDVIGGWRQRYRSQDKGDRPTYKLHGRNIYEYKLGPAVDATGELADGRKFADVRDFKKLLMEQQDQIARAITGKLLIYGTGAGIQFADRWAIEDILKKAKAHNLGLRSLVHEVVQSPTFGSK